MRHCPGSGQELLSVLGVMEGCQYSRNFLMPKFLLSMIVNDTVVRTCNWPTLGVKTAPFFSLHITPLKRMFSINGSYSPPVALSGKSQIFQKLLA